MNEKRYDLYVGKLLYMSTKDIVKAKNVFKKWEHNGANVTMNVVEVKRVAA